MKWSWRLGRIAGVDICMPPAPREWHSRGADYAASYLRVAQRNADEYPEAAARFAACGLEALRGVPAQEAGSLRRELRRFAGR